MSSSQELEACDEIVVEVVLSYLRCPPVPEMRAFTFYLPDARNDMHAWMDVRNKHQPAVARFVPGERISMSGAVSGPSDGA